MSEALKRHLVEIEARIVAADKAADVSLKTELLEELERHIEELEARGGEVPESVLRRVRPEGDAEVEDMFDNMPV